MLRFFRKSNVRDCRTIAILLWSPSMAKRLLTWAQKHCINHKCKSIITFGGVPKANYCGSQADPAKSRSVEMHILQNGPQGNLLGRMHCNPIMSNCRAKYR
ncbi:hypothetical protein F4801DRAFT_528326 [Xylaria longipes]|nr:hypothetical protein F4801DRAFT_528326 [Xylaria longipes]